MVQKKPTKEKPNKLLGTALSQAKAISHDGVMKASKLDRGVKKRLLVAGYLMEVMKGWYLLTQPNALGTSTAWFGGFWSFLKYYLSDRFGKKGYCLSAESSIDLLSGESTLLNQITIITKKSSNQTIELPRHTSLFLYGDKKKFQLSSKPRMGFRSCLFP
jgi:hypothetical protein